MTGASINRQKNGLILPSSFFGRSNPIFREKPVSLSSPRQLRPGRGELSARGGHAGHRGCQLLHLGADGEKFSCWTSDDRGLKCRLLLGMSRRANGNGLIACRDFRLHRQAWLSVTSTAPALA